MKRLSSSDSLGALMSICPTSAEDQSQRTIPATNILSHEFQSMLDNLDEEGSIVEEYSGSGGSHLSKKRRLSVVQVKALEKNFEIENKLEPERKVKLAQELGLQPRQVAVWFQNRRARWKTKQLERDYGILKADFDALKGRYDELQRDNEALLKEIQELKSKLDEEGNNTSSNISIKEEEEEEEEEEETPQEEQTEPSPPPPLPHLLEEAAAHLSYESFLGADLYSFKDGGSSDSSDSSAVTAATVAASYFKFVKTEIAEEHEDFLSGEEAACSFFYDEQPPSLQW